MGCAIIGVMLFHAPDDYLWDLSYHFFSRFGRWGVELFLFVSGFGIYFALAKKESLLRFYKKRLTRIMPAAIIAGCITYMVHPEEPEALVGFNFWYIRTILIFYLLSPLFLKIIHKERALCYMIPLCICCYFIAVYSDDFLSTHTNRPITVSFCWTLKRLPAYLIGLYLASFIHKGEKATIPSKWIPASIICFLCALALRIGYDFELYTHYYTLCAAYLFLGLSMPVVCLGLIRLGHYLPTRLRHFTAWVGTISLELYVTHNLLFELMEYTLPELPRLGITLALLLSLPVAWLLHFCIDFTLNKLSGSKKEA